MHSLPLLQSTQGGKGWGRVEVGDFALAKRVAAGGYLKRKGRRMLRVEQERRARSSVIIAEQGHTSVGRPTIIASD